jgi:HSP90 family molecular chaperone
MTEVGEDTQPAMCYPHRQQYEEWQTRAERNGYNSLSQFMIEMIEAGSKEIEISVALDENQAELRSQRNELREQLRKARNRIAELEDEVYSGERQEILNLLAEQTDGATFAEIVQHLIDDAPARVAQQLDEMEGADLTRENNRYRTSEVSEHDN